MKVAFGGTRATGQSEGVCGMRARDGIRVHQLVEELIDTKTALREAMREAHRLQRDVEAAHAKIGELREKRDHLERQLRRRHVIVRIQPGAWEGELAIVAVEEERHAMDKADP